MRGSIQIETDSLLNTPFSKEPVQCWVRSSGIIERLMLSLTFAISYVRKPAVGSTLSLRPDKEPHQKPDERKQQQYQNPDHFACGTRATLQGLNNRINDTNQKHQA